MLKKTPENTYLCSKCSFPNPFATVRLLGMHIALTHKMPTKEYYDEFLREPGEGKTEHDITLERGLYRIYDCGQYKYVWKRGQV